MPLMRQSERMQMEWCLDCHRHPERALRPRTEITNMSWESGDQAALGAHLAAEYHVRGPRDLTSCSTCHR
jgi:hypothetical protein